MEGYLYICAFQKGSRKGHHVVFKKVIKNPLSFLTWGTCDSVSYI